MTYSIRITVLLNSKVQLHYTYGATHNSVFYCMYGAVAGELPPEPPNIHKIAEVSQERLSPTRPAGRTRGPPSSALVIIWAGDGGQSRSLAVDTPLAPAPHMCASTARFAASPPATPTP